MCVCLGRGIFVSFVSFLVCFCLVCFDFHVLFCLILERLGENMKLGGCRGEEDLRGVGRGERK